MESPSDFYAIALHDDQLRASLIAPHRQGRPRQTALARSARAALAASLRGLAAAVEAPRPTATADQPLAARRISEVA
jgi:hypothetical protein